jgi:ABC-type uncharacterized transport system fused permease/ATPase subunit
MNKLEYLKRSGKWYWHLTYPYWFSPEKFKAFGILLAIIVIILLNARIEVLNNGLQGEYMTALSNKNIDDFYNYSTATIGNFVFTTTTLHWARFLARSRQFKLEIFTISRFDRIY